MDSGHLQGFHTVQGGAKAQPPPPPELTDGTHLTWLPPFTRGWTVGSFPTGREATPARAACSREAHATCGLTCAGPELVHSKLGWCRNTGSERAKNVATGRGLEVFLDEPIGTEWYAPQHRSRPQGCQGL